MKLSAKFVRSQFVILRPLLSETSVESGRRGIDTIGKLLSRMGRSKVEIKDTPIDEMKAVTVCPKDELSSGVMLYLHGGGYTCGSIDYAKGFATVLASKIGIKVLAIEYTFL